MKILIIDSHKSNDKTDIVKNLHWKNAKILSDHLGADLIWSYPDVNSDVRSGYDIIIFNHSSPYSYIDQSWLEQNRAAKFVFVTNEYNLGEDMLLWKFCKENNLKFTVISNHPKEASKVVKYLVDEWHILNLNCLIARDTPFQKPFMLCEPEDVIYYGSFRKDRQKYFLQYQNQVTFSTHQKNLPRFKEIGMHRFRWIDRIDVERDLGGYIASLYIEDTKTHTHYNFLPNRFYESINADIPMVIDQSCLGSIDKSGYPLLPFVIGDDLKHTAMRVRDFDLSTLRSSAIAEKAETLDKINKILNGL